MNGKTATLINRYAAGFSSGANMEPRWEARHAGGKGMWVVPGVFMRKVQKRAWVALNGRERAQQRRMMARMVAK